MNHNNLSRRKFIGQTSLLLASSLFLNNTEVIGKESVESYLNNPTLKTIKEGWKGNKLIDGRFVYNPPIQMKKFSDILKWKLGKNPYKEAKKLDFYKVPVQKNDNIFNTKEDCIVWMGHSSFFIRIGGFNLLTDPVYYKIPMVERYSELPCEINKIQNIDYILLSHDHRDHFDKKTLKEILPQNPKAEALLALKTSELFESTSKTHAWQEAGWYQEYKLPEGLKITYLPAKHWCRRGMSDTNERLWGSFMIEARGKKLYFAADTAYDSHFTEIGNLFPNIDYCFLPIGAYKPPSIMKDFHTSPEEAVQAFQDLKGNKFIPMHYGTFDLSDEPHSEPINILKEFEKNGILKEKLLLLEIGQIVKL